MSKRQRTKRATVDYSAMYNSKAFNNEYWTDELLPWVPAAIAMYTSDEQARAGRKGARTFEEGIHEFGGEGMACFAYAFAAAKRDLEDLIRQLDAATDGLSQVGIGKDVWCGDVN